MTAHNFYKLVVALWGDHWQKPCLAYLATHGHIYRRQSLWNWRAGKWPVPQPIAVILNSEAEARGIAPE